MEVATLWPLSQGELSGHRERFVDTTLAGEAEGLRGGFRPRGLVRRGGGLTGKDGSETARERDPEAAGFGPSGYLVDGRPERRTRNGLFDLNLVFAPDGIETFIDASLPSAPQ